MVNQSKGIFINGKHIPSENTYDHKAPYSGAVLAKISLGKQEDVEASISAAHQAAIIMKEMPAHQRAEILLKVVDLLAERKQEAAEIIAKEAGKPIALALGEVSRAMNTYRLSAEEGKRLYGEFIPMDASPGGENRIGMTWLEPLGVVVAITPFNFPLNLVAHKLGPAIAAGNTVVLKPAEQTPLSALFIADLFKEAGLPDGALNLVTGDGAALSDALLLDERVSKVTFTGSVPVGKLIKSKIGLKRCTLELGSNSALIIEPDVDLDKVVTRSVFGAFAFMGQVCISIQRIFVHHTIYEAYIKQFKKETEALIIGDPMDESTVIGAMINEQEAIRIESWIQEDIAAGATAICGNQRNGSICSPTVLVDTTSEMNIRKKEAFAPVVTITPYQNLDEAIALSNDSDYGLNVGIYTKDISKAFYAARKLESGGIIINDIPTFRVDHMPYGGVKNSGYGREGIRYAIKEMTEIKFVTIKTDF